MRTRVNEVVLVERYLGGEGIEALMDIYHKGWETVYEIITRHQVPRWPTGCHPRRKLNGRFSLEWKACIDCGEKIREHAAHGLCHRCWGKWWARMNEGMQGYRAWNWDQVQSYILDENLTRKEG